MRFLLQPIAIALLLIPQFLYAQTECYHAAPIPYAPDPYNLGNSVQLGDDEFSDPIDIGFGFCFFNVYYDQLLIGSNGIVSFDTSLAGTNCAYNLTEPVPYTTEQDARNAIFGPWQDLNPGLGGGIFYATYGIAPFRRFVVSYSEVPMYTCTDSLFSNQIVIYEGSNSIDVNIDSKYFCPTWNEGAAILGIQDTSGTEAYWAENWNYPLQWEAFEVAYRFSPVCYCEDKSSGNQMIGKVYLVEDQDCIPDIDEPGIPNAIVEVQPSGSYAWTNVDGFFTTSNFDEEFEVSQQPITGMDQVCPFSLIYEFDTTSSGALLTDLNFGNIVDSLCFDLSVTLANTGIANCETNQHSIHYCNNGNMSVNDVEVVIEFSPFSGIVSSSVPYTVQGGGNQASFEVGTLGPFECGSFTFTDTIACSFGAGNVLCYNTAILPISSDCNTADNSIDQCQTTHLMNNGNHKLVRSLTDVEEGLVSSTEWVLGPNLPYAEYIIRFQNNTGETQQNMWIIDPISDLLNVSTLVPLASSHPYNLSFSNGELRFNYIDIDLPTASQDPIGSKGYVSYKVRLDESVTDQSTIPNAATIHFGDSSTITTNTASINALPNSIADLEVLDFSVVPNPSNGSVKLIGIVGRSQYQLFDLQGRIVSNGATNGELELQDLTSGSFFLQILNQGRLGTKKILIY